MGDQTGFCIPSPQRPPTARGADCTFPSRAAMIAKSRLRLDKKRCCGDCARERRVGTGSDVRLATDVLYALFAFLNWI